MLLTFMLAPLLTAIVLITLVDPLVSATLGAGFLLMAVMRWHETDLLQAVPHALIAALLLAACHGTTRLRAEEKRRATP